MRSFPAVAPPDQPPGETSKRSHSACRKTDLTVDLPDIRNGCFVWILSYTIRPAELAWFNPALLNL